MKKLILLTMALCIAFVLAACGNDSDDAAKKKKDDEAKTEKQAGQQDQQVEITDDEKVKNDDVVVQVNDAKVKGKEYNDAYAQTKMLMNQNGADVSDKDQLKDQAVNVLVQQELLKQDAKKKGIDVSDKKVESEFKKLKSQDEDQFAAFLDQYNMSEDAYKDQLAFELTLQEYIKQEIPDTEVTDKEVKSYYDKLKEQSDGEQSEDIPKLKEIKDQIKDQLTQQKQNDQLSAKVEDLKKDAKIKNMI